MVSLRDATGLLMAMDDGDRTRAQAILDLQENPADLIMGVGSIALALARALAQGSQEHVRDCLERMAVELAAEENE